MAEVLFRSLASQRLGCSEDKLRHHNIDVLSAGVAAAENLPASSGAIQVMKDKGISLSEHLSQLVTEEMLVKSDIILAMTPAHLNILRNARPDLVSRMKLLSSSGEGISDPIGGTTEDYRQCASEISDCIQSLLDELFTKDTE